MSDRKTVNLKNPITWIVLALCLAVGVGVGIFGDWASGGGGDREEVAPPAKRPPPARKRLTPPSSKLPRLAGEGYSIPMPEGFAVPPDEIASKARKLGGLIVMAKRRQPDQFKGSVVVIPAAKLPDGSSLTYLDDPTKACAEVNAVPLSKSKTRVVRLPSGEVCQRVGLRPDRDKVGQTLTLFHPKGVDAAWSVTCNYDLRDDVAKEGCIEVLTGWRYEKSAAGSRPDAGPGSDGGPVSAQR